MKLSNLFFAICCGVFANAANAANITIFYAPTCPHCHHARDFISNTLIYEYDELLVEEVNVANVDNRQAFVDALYKCGYHKGGVPVIVIGEKCFQGYSDASQADLRAAIEIDLTDAQKSAATENRNQMAQNKDAFVAAHPDRKNAVSEKDTQKKNNEVQN